MLFFGIILSLPDHFQEGHHFWLGRGEDLADLLFGVVPIHKRFDIEMLEPAIEYFSTG